MKKVIFAAILFVSMSTMAFAQDAKETRMRTPEERAKQMTARLTKQLSLSSDQESKIYALNLEAAKKAKASRAEAKDGQKPDREALKAAMQSHDEQINKVLTEEQRETYKEMKAKRMKAMKDRGKNRRSE